MAFIDERLPVEVEQGAQGGPGFKTTVTSLSSGFEKRNQVWSNARSKFDVGYGIQNKEAYSEVLAFFYVCKGMAHSFRFKDWADFEVGSTDAHELIGTGTGALATFQIIKTYTVGSSTYVRTITKPIDGTLSVWVADVLKTETTHYNVNYATGVITFTGGNEPGNGLQVKVVCEYDIVVRFDTDDMSVTLSTYDAGSIPNVPLVEVRGE